MTSAQTPTYPPVADDLTVDVVVVGGGITGVTAAYLLKQAGRRVALVERARCGWGETGRSTAHVTAVPDTSPTDLIARLGLQQAHAVWEAGFAAVSRIRANVRDERINCQFGWVPGFLHAESSLPVADARAFMIQEAEAATALGIDAVYLDAVPGLGRPGVKFENQARLHPLRYLEVLLARIDGDGSHVFEESEVTAIEDAPLAVRVGRFRLRTDYVVLATHVPVQREPWLLSELGLKTTYVVRGVAAHGDLAEGLYWDTRAEGYDYLRIDRHETYDDVVLGGCDAPEGTGDDAAAFTQLEDRLNSRIPGLAITHRWKGTVVETRDRLPCIGEMGPHKFAATGFGGNGLTYGTVAGIMAADAALGRRNPWRDLFDIRRSNGPGGNFGTTSETRQAQTASAYRPQVVV